MERPALATVTRRIDTGRPLLLTHQASDGQAHDFVVTTHACVNPDCPCREMQLVIERIVRHADGRTLVKDPGHLVLDYNVDSSEPTLVKDRPNPFSLELTQGLFDEVRSEKGRELLQERWARYRGSNETGRVPAGFRPGDLASYSEVFPHAFDLMVHTGSKAYVANDSYCLGPDCTCAAITVDFIEVPSGEAVGFVRATLPARANQGVEGSATARALWSQLLKTAGASELRKRFRRIRTFAQSLRPSVAPLASDDKRPNEPIQDLAPNERVYLFRMFLLGTIPPVWRRIEVRGDQSLQTLAKAATAAMGWSRPKATSFFRLNTQALPIEEEEAELDPRASLVAAGLEPGAILEHTREDDKDHWSFEVLVEAVTRATPGAPYPRTIDGEGAPPPESCEGAEAYEDLITAFLDPEAADHEKAIRVLGEAFDPQLIPPRLGLVPPTQAREVPATPADIAPVLEATGSLLMERTRKGVLALKESAGPALLEILEREIPKLTIEGDEDSAWTVHHAVQLLGELSFAPALPLLLDLMGELDETSDLHFEIAQALLPYGEALLEPALSALANSDGTHRATMLRTTLSQTGLRDPRILAALLAAFEAGEPGAAADLAVYGDPAALPALYAAFERRRTEAEGGNRSAGVELSMITIAIKELGGELTGEQRDLLQRIDPAEPSRKNGEPVLPKSEPLKVAAKPGRNEPCWCGSGKKYKKCHLDADEKTGRAPDR